jgi:hypothetical protein
LVALAAFPGETDAMKRLMFFLAMGLLVMNITTGCNKADNGTPSMSSTNSPATNATDAPAH